MVIWKVPGFINFRVSVLGQLIDPQAEEETASRMSSHVSVISTLLDASGHRLAYPAAVPPWVRQSQKLLPGGKALLACQEKTKLEHERLHRQVHIVYKVYK